jgi:hypothetical protein
MTTSLERFKKNAPKGYCGDPGRGAAMGRVEINPTAEPSGPLTVCYVALDGDGYDVCGAYWGNTPKHYTYFAYGSTEDGEDIELFILAKSLLDAKEYLSKVADIRVIEGEDIDFSEEEEEKEKEKEEEEEDNLGVSAPDLDKACSVVDDLSVGNGPSYLPGVLNYVVYDMCLRACDHGAGAHDLAEMLRDVARRLDSADEDVVQDRRDEGDAATWGMA